MSGTEQNGYTENNSNCDITVLDKYYNYTSLQYVTTRKCIAKPYHYELYLLVFSLKSKLNKETKKPDINQLF